MRREERPGRTERERGRLLLSEVIARWWGRKGLLSRSPRARKPSPLVLLFLEERPAFLILGRLDILVGSDGETWGDS